MSGGGYWSKSVNASAATVNWSLHGDGRIFYLNVQPGSSNALVNQICSGKVFGDVIPTKPGGDPYACCLNYAQTATIGNQTDGAFGASGDFKFAMPRDFTGLGSSVMYGAWTLTGNGGVSGLANALGSFPSPIDGGLWLCKKFLYTSILSSPRAIFPGLLNVVQSGVWNSFKQGDSVPGSGIYAGKNLMAATTSDNSTAFTTASTAANTGIIFFDVTGPWR
jgi:hypothetical protein